VGASADEGSIWARAAGGDERAFAVLFDRHYERVFRYALRLSDQPADADEVSAATFLALWELRSRVRIVGESVLPWLLVTAGNLARNHGRSAQRYRRVLQRMPRDLDSVDAAEMVADHDLARRHARALAAALDRLPAKDALLLTLTALEELSITDAAGVIGISPGAARVRLHRSRIKLRALIDLPEETALQGDTR
jgi:RNA polymerase sigma factor (sigma-70 family)